MSLFDLVDAATSLSEILNLSLTSLSAFDLSTPAFCRICSRRARRLLRPSLESGQFQLCEETLEQGLCS